MPLVSAFRDPSACRLAAGGRWRLAPALLPGLLAALVVAAPPLGAATREPPDPARVARGEPVEQRVLAAGVSVVTTPRGRSCVASVRLDVAASTYLGDEGGSWEPLPFDRIVRSPAASVQAMLGADAEPGAVPAFRVQLKFSPRPGTSVALLIGPEAAARRLDLAPVLEASTDSLLIEGEAALALRDAFRGGVAAHLASTSRDTGHRVTDALAAPDLAALADCAEDLAAEGDVGALPGPLAGQVSLSFEAAPTPETLATPERLRTCGMRPTDRPLHVGHLVYATGFFAQTDTVFVAFDDAGRVERAYIPGILDADLSDGPEGVLRVSQAADGNVPDAANAVTGCIGAREVPACLSPDGPGRHRLAACDVLPAGPALPPAGIGTPGAPPLVLAGVPSPGAAPGPGPGGVPLIPVIGPGTDPSTGPGPGGDGEPPVPPPAPIPLPGAAALLLAALAGLGLARRGL